LNELTWLTFRVPRVHVLLAFLNAGVGLSE